MKLYNIDGCGYCAMVRDAMAQMGLEYETIDVPWSHPERKEVYEVSGQTTVPVLVDGDTCLLYTSPSPRDGLLSRMPSSA